jgi:hypothetical protein
MPLGRLSNEIETINMANPKKQQSIASPIKIHPLKIQARAQKITTNKNKVFSLLKLSIIPPPYLYDIFYSLFKKLPHNQIIPTSWTNIFSGCFATSSTNPQDALDNEKPLCLCGLTHQLQLFFSLPSPILLHAHHISFFHKKNLLKRVFSVDK